MTQLLLILTVSLTLIGCWILARRFPILKKNILSIIIFILSAIPAFYLEENYRELVRYFYETLTYHKISFFQPGKYLHFPSGLYVASFGLFTASFYYFLTNQTNRQRVINIVLAFVVFVISTILNCYFDGTVKLIECTACDNGTRTLEYNDIKYDIIFITSLILAISPTIITELKIRSKNKKHPFRSISKTNVPP